MTDLGSDRPDRRRHYGEPRLVRIGPMRRPSWRDVLLPELSWIAALHRSHGRAAGDAHAHTLAAAALALAPDARGWFAAASDYGELDAGRKAEMVRHLGRDGSLPGLVAGLTPFLSAYGDCPLAFLLDGHSPPPVGAADVPEDVEGLLAALMEETSRSATFAQATALDLGLASGRLEAAEGSLWRDRETLDAYPETVRSRAVAAAIRSAVPVVVFEAEEEAGTAPWVRSFWTRCLELRPGLRPPDPGPGRR